MNTMKITSENLILTIPFENGIIKEHQVVKVFQDAKDAFFKFLEQNLYTQMEIASIFTERSSQELWNDYLSDIENNAATLESMPFGIIDEFMPEDECEGCIGCIGFDEEE